MFSAGGTSASTWPGCASIVPGRSSAPPDEPVARLALEPAVDADDAPRDVVVDRRPLAGPPDERDDREAAAARDVQQVLAVAVGAGSLVLGREPAVLREQGAAAARRSRRVSIDSLGVPDELGEGGGASPKGPSRARTRSLVQPRATQFGYPVWPYGVGDGPRDRAQRRPHDPAARLRRVPDRARRDRRARFGARSRSATAISTPPRCTATSAASGRRSAPRGWTAPTSSSPASSTTARTGPTTRGGRSRDAGRRSASTTWTCSSSTGRCRRCTTATSCRPGRRWRSSSATAARARSACRTSRSSTSSGSPPRPTSCPRSTRSSCTRTCLTTRCASTARSTGSPPRRGRRSPRARCSRIRRSSRLPPARPHARPGRAALAHPARQHRVPEVDDARRGSRENFALFDFELAPEDMDAIAALDRGEAGRTGPNPDTFDRL